MSKNFYYTLLALLFFNTVNAQIVNIPDANFKAKLLAASPTNTTAKNIAGAYFKIDSNSNNEIEVSEALNVSYLDCHYSSISYMTGIENFINLKHLNCFSNFIPTIDLSNSYQLYYLNCSSNILTSLNFNSINLTYLNCNDNQLTNLDVSNATNLTYLSCNNNQLINLNINNCIQLIDLEFLQNQISNISLTTNLNIQNLYCFNNNLNSLNVGNNQNLINLSCFGNNITNLDLSNNITLTYLNCAGNQITNLNLINNSLLNSLHCQSNMLTSLGLKNGFAMFNLTFNDNSNLQYICADEVEITTIQDLINSYGYSNTCIVNSYCSFNPGGTYYTINGNTKFDNNNNGCDNLDNVYQNLKLDITDGVNAGTIISNATGNYTIPVSAGLYTITPILQNPTYFTVSPSTLNVTIPTATSPFTQNFCVIPNGLHTDLEVIIIPMDLARPGFDATYKIIYNNKGTSIQSGNINLTFDEDVLDFVSANPTVSSQTTSNLNWSFTNLLPFESRVINVTFNLNSPLETPPLNSGNTLGYNATISSPEVDEMIEDNTFSIKQTVVNSFDPNDKTCLQGTTVTPDKIGEYVHYMIRFQNDGTASAQNIVVKDIIDTAKFDIASLVPVDASHIFTTKISDTNKVEFIFQNINLPFATGSNTGYVTFKIKTKSTLVLGNTFSNLANIYFDYNFPIITNNYTTTIAALATQDFEFKNYFSLYPNPAKDLLNIEVKNDIEISSISIYNMLGQVVLVQTNDLKAIDVSSLKTGNYFVKINTDKGATNSRFVKE